MEKCKPCSELFTLLSNAVTKLSTGIRREEPSMVREGGEEIKRVVSEMKGMTCISPVTEAAVEFVDPIVDNAVLGRWEEASKSASDVKDFLYLPAFLELLALCLKERA
jgi:hypothetical protein